MKSQFLNDINANMGIIHKVCSVYTSPNTDDRKDLFQEIMYQLWKSYPKFKGDSKFSTWMYKVALNTALLQLHKKIHSLTKEKLEREHYWIPDSTENAGKDEQIQQLYKIISSLSKIDRAIILLSLEDHSYDEIATLTGLTKTNVSVRLVRIKRLLKEKLQHTLKIQ